MSWIQSIAASAVMASAAAVVPGWAPTYNMQQSTVVMPCNNSGLYDATIGQFGIVDFDWSNGKQIWANMQPMDAEGLLVEQAGLVKSANNASHVWVYRNLVKALPWFSGVREKINDPAYSGWFLHFKPTGPYSVPQCDNNWSPPRCSNLYHDQDQTPQHPHGDGSCTEPCDCGGVPCGEYLWDHRNASLRDWLINEHILGPTGLGNANISGFYLDDGWTNYSAAVLPWEPQPNGYCDHSPIGGPTEEDYNCTSDMGLTQEDTTAIRDAWQQTIMMVTEAIVSNGGFLWQGFLPASTPVAGAPDSCATFFRQACSSSSEWYTSALQYSWGWNKTSGELTQLNEDLASFMLIRGPYAWIGYGWLGCTDDSRAGAGGAPYAFPPELGVDYGQPTEVCHETTPGSSRVFTRSWSKASVSFDCNTWTGTVTPAVI